MVKQDRNGYFIKGAYHEGYHPTSFPVEVKDRHTRPLPDNHPLSHKPAKISEPTHYPVCNCSCKHDEINDELPIWTYPLIGAFVALFILFLYMFKVY